MPSCLVMPFEAQITKVNQNDQREPSHNMNIVLYILINVYSSYVDIKLLLSF